MTATDQAFCIVIIASILLVAALLHYWHYRRRLGRTPTAGEKTHKKSFERSRSGIVERIGPYFAPNERTGIVILLRGDPKPYRADHEYQQNSLTLGLTKCGDEVVFEVDRNGYVKLATFRNTSFARLEVRG